MTWPDGAKYAGEW